MIQDKKLRKKLDKEMVELLKHPIIQKYGIGLNPQAHKQVHQEGLLKTKELVKNLKRR